MVGMLARPQECGTGSPLKSLVIRMAMVSGTLVKVIRIGTMMDSGMGLSWLGSLSTEMAAIGLSLKCMRTMSHSLTGTVSDFSMRTYQELVRFRYPIMITVPCHYMRTLIITCQMAQDMHGKRVVHLVGTMIFMLTQEL